MSAAPESRCARCEASIEQDDLRCPLCGLPTPKRAGARRPGATVVRCDGCSAAVTYLAERGAPVCPFCGATTHLEEVADPPEHAEGALPFLFDAPKARSVLTGWLARRGPFTPSDLASVSAVESLRPLYWPAWVVSGRARVSWTADSDAGSGRAAWAPHAGEVGLEFADLTVPGSRGLTLSECRKLGERYDFTRVRAAPADDRKAAIESFELRRSEARARILDDLYARALAHVAEREVPGSRTRHLKVALLLERLSTRRLLLPAWVLGYRYRKKVYRVVVHGQQPECVIGQAPLSVWKVLVAVMGLVGVGAALAFWASKN